MLVKPPVQGGAPVVADVFLVFIPFQRHVPHSVAGRALVLGGVAAGIR